MRGIGIGLADEEREVLVNAQHQQVRATHTMHTACLVLRTAGVVFGWLSLCSFVLSCSTSGDARLSCTPGAPQPAKAAPVTVVVEAKLKTRKVCVSGCMH